jgi:hypothetical protein
VKNAPINKVALWRQALIRKGVWWWADDTDNPFGHALLACPRISSTSHLGSMVYLYTLEEAYEWSFPKLIARERSPSPMSKVGWLIYHGNKVTNWTLPPRLTPNVTAKLIRKRVVKYNKGLKK